MKYYSALKKSKIIPFAYSLQMDNSWMDPDYMPSEVRQRKTNIIRYHLHVKSKRMIQINFFYKTETDSQI